MLALSELEEFLKKFRDQGGFLSYSQILELLPGFYEKRVNGVRYLSDSGFLEYVFHNGSSYYEITEKALKLLEKEGGDKVSEKDKIIKFLKRHPRKSKKEISHHLGKPQGTVYTYLKDLECDGEIIHEVDGRKHLFSVPKRIKAKVQSPPETKTLEAVIVHTPEEVLNNNTDFTGVVGNGWTIGKVIDQVWPYSTSIECRKSGNHKNNMHDTVLARFRDQLTCIEVFNDLPSDLQTKTKVTIDPRNKKIQLTIPLPF